jgi:hypothetical protein
MTALDFGLAYFACRLLIIHRYQPLQGGFHPVTQIASLIAANHHPFLHKAGILNLCASTFSLALRENPLRVLPLNRITVLQKRLRLKPHGRFSTPP